MNLDNPSKIEADIITEIENVSRSVYLTKEQTNTAIIDSCKNFNIDKLNFSKTRINLIILGVKLNILLNHHKNSNTAMVSKKFIYFLTEIYVNNYDRQKPIKGILKSSPKPINIQSKRVKFDPYVNILTF